MSPINARAVREQSSTSVLSQEGDQTLHVQGWVSASAIPTSPGSLSRGKGIPVPVTLDEQLGNISS